MVNSRAQATSVRTAQSTHVGVVMCMCTGVCMERGVLTGTPVETPETTDTDLSKQAAVSIRKNFGPGYYPRAPGKEVGKITVECPLTFLELKLLIL